MFLIKIDNNTWIDADKIESIVKTITIGAIHIYLQGKSSSYIVAPDYVDAFTNNLTALDGNFGIENHEGK